MYLLHVDWCWWQYGVEWACAIALLAGVPVMTSSERKGLEKLGYCFQLGHNIIARIASYWLQDDLVSIEIVSAHKVWALSKHHTPKQIYPHPCPPPILEDASLIGSCWHYLPFRVLIFFFSLFNFWLCPVACRTLFPDQGLILCPLQWKHTVLTTGPPGKSLGSSSLSIKQPDTQTLGLLLTLKVFLKKSPIC